MRIVVISLPDSHERRAAATAQFATAGLPYEFFDGIDGSTATAALFEAIDDNLYQLNSGRLPSPGEIGCHASHRAVWEYCIELGEAIIVLEDDAQIEANFVAAVAEAKHLINTYGFIRLQHLRNAPKVKVTEAGEFELYYCKKYPHGAVAYAISPAAAKKLVLHSKTLTAPADKFIKNFWVHGQPMYCLLPESVAPGLLNEDSTISGRHKPSSGLGLQIKRVAFNLSSAIQRSLFNLKHQP